MTKKSAVLAVFVGVAALTVLAVRERKAMQSNKYPDAASTARIGAERGDPKAQYNLGSAYYYGKGVPQDYAEALRWYKNAADQGEPRAEDALGYIYSNGVGVTRDYAQAMQWYRRASEHGNAKAQFDLASMYYYGMGVQQDYAEALRWSRKAADQNYAKGEDAVASLYYNGLGVQQDYSEVLVWYRRAAEHGYAKAQVDLASMYYKGVGTAQNYSEARRWYIKAAKQGNADARQALTLFGAESNTATKLEYLEFLGGLALGLWVLVSFFVHRGNILDWRQAALLLLGLAFLGISGMSLYVILQGGLAYCSYPIAFHIAKRSLIGTAILILVTVVLPARKKPNARPRA